MRSLDLQVYDSDGQIFFKRRLDEQAISPSIALIAERNVPPRGSLDILNPFFCFDEGLPINRLQYRFSFKAEQDENFNLETDVYPRRYLQTVMLDMPIKGRILVDDGNDFYSQHRRLTLNHPLIRQMGITTNMQRYAWDFMVVDKDGYVCKSDGGVLQDYYGFGHPIYAPANGKVFEVRTGLPDDPPDDPSLSVDDFISEPILSMGNYIIIDHGTGEYSLIGHCQQGSINLEEGNLVNGGEIIACIGNSGWTIRPHLHYQLMDDPDFAHTQVLPARFKEFSLVLGSQTQTILNDYPDSGEIIYVR
ncbi:MAG: M23 family metallopeptidase [Anaerolineales bacterium]